MDCYFCDVAIEEESPVELISDAGERVRMHGTCVIKNYSWKSLNEDEER